MARHRALLNFRSASPLTVDFAVVLVGCLSPICMPSALPIGMQQLSSPGKRMTPASLGFANGAEEGRQGKRVYNHPADNLGAQFELAAEAKRPRRAATSRCHVALCQPDAVPHPFWVGEVVRFTANKTQSVTIFSGRCIAVPCASVALSQLGNAVPLLFF